MRTLRDEALRIGRAHQHYLPSYDMFMGEYGSYWVAEGVLKTVRQANGRLAVELWDGMGHRVAIIGRVSDRVKLILPPEEKGVQADVEAQIVAICAERDRYERALREIAGIPGEVLYVSGTECQRPRRIARKALDD